jgi:tetratricopeptide (TPR) repeat protein
MPRSGAIVVLAALCLSCRAPLYERPWIQVETPNFEILSTLSKQEVVELAKQLELFRVVVQSTTNLQPEVSVIPTKILVFRNQNDFRMFEKSKGVAGYFSEGMRANYIVMRKSQELEEVQVIRHEYVHFLMNNSTRMLYPPWFSEGFAEFLSTVTLHGDGEHVIIGAFPMARRSAFKYGTRVPYGEIISARPGSKIYGNMFYEQSWALVHWIQLGRGPSHSPRAETLRYLELIETGRSDVESFEEAFGVTMEETYRQLRTYLSRDYEAVAVPLDSLGYEAVEPEVREMVPEQITVDLGELALSRDRAKLARTFFKSAIALDPTDSRAHAGLGAALHLSKNWDFAEPHFLRALELDPDNAENELDYAEYLHGKALLEQNENESDRLLREARRHYVRSYKLDASIPETYAMYGSSFLEKGQDPTRGIESLKHAYSLLPSNQEILVLLAKAYVLAGRRDDARPFVERYVANMHKRDRVARVDEVMDELAETEAE